MTPPEQSGPGELKQASKQINAQKMGTKLEAVVNYSKYDKRSDTLSLNVVFI